MILVNAINPLPDWLEQEFVNVVDYHDVDSRCYDALTRMLNDFEETVGVSYTFNSAYRTWAEQTLVRASVFGVTNKGVTFVDLLTALVDR